MKKITTFLCFSFICLNLFSQRVITNPKFTATTASNVQITRITISDTATVLDFTVRLTPKSWMLFAKDNYIAATSGTDKMYSKAAIGYQGNLGDKWFMPDSGVVHFSLVYPPIDPKIDKIDFIETENAEGAFKIFGIEINPSANKGILPEPLLGNWLKTDGSNEWSYGFYKNGVIYDNEFWTQVMISQNGKDFRISLRKEGKSKELFVRLSKNNTISVRTDNGKMQLYSRSKTFKKDYVITDNTDFELPIFKSDTAIYKGYIKNYSPRMAKTGMIYVNDILTQNQNSNLITINPDGTFIVKCFMIHPQSVYVSLTDFMGTVFLEPGKTNVHFIDNSESPRQFQSRNDYNKRERKSLFMGELARVNADLQSTDSINSFDYEKVRSEILRMNADQYKIDCLDIMKRNQLLLANYSDNYQLCKKAFTIRQLEIPYNTYQNILSYNSYKESAYRQKNNIPREQREIPLENEELNPDYFSFMQVNKLNDPVSLVTGDAYNSLINRIQYADCVSPKANIQFVAFADSIHRKGIVLQPKEEKMLNELIACKNGECMNLIIKNDSATSRTFFEKYTTVFHGTSIFDKVQNDNYSKYFGLKDGLAKDIMLSQIISGRMKGSFKPLNEDDIQKIKKEIKTDFIEDYLLHNSKALEEDIAHKKEALKAKSGYSINETPKTTGDKLFETIIQKYKGKVVFVDFWATWCSPCRSGIEQIKPIKEEYKNKDIVFVYITDESSPIDTWNLLIPDIKGEHYRVNNDEWNYLKAKFNISGIPHYALVNKTGEVVKNNFHFEFTINAFKEVINEYLN